MLFWIFAILLTLISAAIVLVPIFRAPFHASSEIDHDKAIYHARIKEIEKDETLKRLTSQEAEAARAEEARKLIELAGDTKGTTVQSTSISNAFAICTAIAIPLIAFCIYLPTGNPHLPDQSLVSRMKADPNEQTGEQLLARAEAHLAKSPNDARGWSVVAPIYTRLDRKQDAVTAWANVLRLSPKFPNIRSLLGEAILATTDGVMNERAFSLFEEEVKFEPSSARARFYYATGLAQAGRAEASAKAWQTLLEGANSQAPWFQAAIANMNAQRKLAGLPELTDFAKKAPGPTQEQVKAAQEMSETDRAAMITNMVEGLSEKLDEDPSNIEQWKSLIKAYTVLGDDEKALVAINKASKHHGEKQAFIAQLNEIKKNIDARSQN